MTSRKRRLQLRRHRHRQDVRWTTRGVRRRFPTALSTLVDSGAVSTAYFSLAQGTAARWEWREHRLGGIVSPEHFLAVLERLKHE